MQRKYIQLGLTSICEVCSWCRKSYILVLNIMIVSKVTNLSQLMKTMRDKCHSTPSQKTCSRSGNGSQILSSVTRTCWQATSHHWKKSIFLNHFFYATISSSCLRSSSLSLSLSLSFLPFFSFSGACFTKGVVTALSSSAFPYYRKEK